MQRPLAPAPFDTCRRLSCAFVVPLVALAALTAARAQTTCSGSRWVEPNGSDAANDCSDAARPCATVSRAVAAASAGETVCVGPKAAWPRGASTPLPCDTGYYCYDDAVVVDKPLTIQSAGDVCWPTLRKVTIRASGVTLRSMSVDGHHGGGACIEIGDAAHPGVRGTQILDGKHHGCAQGVLVTGTGSGAPNVLRGVKNSGLQLFDNDVHVQLVGVNDGLEIRSSVLARAAGSAVNWTAEAGTPQTLTIYGTEIAGSGAAGVEVHGGPNATLRFEGNAVESSATAGVLVDGARLASRCNVLRGNATGVRLANGAAGALATERFVGQSAAALSIDATSTASGVVQSVFTGNALAIQNAGSAAVDARQSWWNAQTGPSGAGNPGTGDAVWGPVNAANFIARTTTPLLVARPASAGDWDSSPGACYPLIAGALAAAGPGDLVMIGAGTYPEPLLVEKSVELRGAEAAPGGCSATVLDGTQPAGQEHQRLLWFRDVAGVTLRDMTLANGGAGVACGAHDGLETGLTLVNVTGSRFANLCFRANGTTEVKVYGNSTDNVFERLDIDGRLPDPTGQCPHVSREGVLIDGGTTCEGGAGGSADRNRVIDSTIRNVVHGLVVRFAAGSGAASTTIAPATSPDGSSGDDAVGVLVGPADGTTLTDLTIDAPALRDGIRVQGRARGECVAPGAPVDATRTAIRGGRIANARGSGVRFAWSSGDAGAPGGTSVSCVDLARNAYGVVADAAAAAGLLNTVRLSALHDNAIAGAENNAADVLPAVSNWWGAASGPRGCGAGAGDAILGPVAACPYLAGSPLADNDGDGFSACQGDCDDARADVYPGAAEPADGIDHDCDGAFAGQAKPAAAGGLLYRAAAGTRSLQWAATAGATGYDLVRGDVAALLGARGDFAGGACLGAALPGTSYPDGADPARGAAFWYLVRARNGAGPGTWDDAGGLARSRDASLAAAAGTCP